MARTWWIFAALALILTTSASGVVSSSCPDVSDVNSAGVCSGRDVCFQEGVNAWNETRRLFGLGIYKRNCQCDGLCWTYGDCCEDIYSMMSTHMKPWGDMQMSPYPQETFQCLPKENATFLKIDDLDSGVLMVRKCPLSWRDDHIRGQCEGGFDPSQGHGSDPFLGWPVTDPESILYSNMYCAICHERPRFNYWNIKVSCSESARNVTVNSREELRALMRERLASGVCDLHFLPPQEVSYRPCKDAIDKCDSNWQDGGCNIKDKCEKGANSYIYVNPPLGSKTNTEIYKNAHCALCNNKLTSDLTCNHMPPFNVNSLSPVPRVYPLSFILDLNSGSGEMTGYDVGHVAGALVNQTVKEMTSCEKNEVYDPFHDICRLVACRTGFVLHSGKCVPDINNFPLGNITSDDDCMRVLINQSEYTIFGNGSLLVESSQELHPKATYDLFEDGSALVCTNLTQNYTRTRTYLKQEVNLKFSSVQTIISVIGQVISLVGLAIHLTVYSMFPKLRNLAGKNLMCLSAALFCGQLLFLTGSSAAGVYGACAVVAILTHYFFVASFGWMNVMAFDIWKTFARSSKPASNDWQSKKFKMYCLFGWGGSLVLILVAVIVNFTAGDSFFRPGYGEKICWIRYRPALILFFAGPVAVIVTINLIFYILTIISIWKISKMAKLVTQKSDKHRLWLYVKLSSIMGLTWIFGFIAASFDSEVLWYFFIIFNSLQGAFICISFVMTRQVLGLFRERFGWMYKPVSTESTTRSTMLSSRSSYVSTDPGVVVGSKKVNQV